MSGSAIRASISRAVLLGAALFGVLAGSAAADVKPLVETTAMNGSDDVADDMGVWLHPTDRSRSIVIGTNKSVDGSGGLYTYGLDGGRSTGAGWQAGMNWFASGKALNNVDVRYNFQAGGSVWDLVAASNRTDDTIDLFRVDAGATGDFVGLAAVGSIAPSHLAGDYPYGLAMFHSGSLNRHYVMASDKDGRVEQFQLNFSAGTGQVTGTSVWHADVSGDGTEIEGIVADDEKEVVYVATENTFLYRYATSGGVVQSAGRVAVDSTAGTNLTADIEGLAIYYAGDGDGYLVASSQGNSEFSVYRRTFAAGTANEHLFNFSIGSGDGIDAVTDTDGIDIVNSGLGGIFDEGMFLAHDGHGDSPTTLKFISWADVADEVVPHLVIDTSWDPRSVPEPATLALIGLAGLAMWTRRRRRVSAPSSAARSCPGRCGRRPSSPSGRRRPPCRRRPSASARRPWSGT